MASTGRRRRGPEAQGRTLPAAERPWHKAYAGTGPVPRRTARKQERERQAAAAGRPPTGQVPDPGDGTELVLGRNPVLAALRAGIPARTLYLAYGIDADDRVRQLGQLAADQGLPVREVARTDLDRLAGDAPHQGVGLAVLPYPYHPFEDLVAQAAAAGSVLVALDGVTDPHNLGAVARSVAAFGGHGVFVPRRRAAGVTAAAWRTSAGAVARLPVARVTNLTRALVTCQEAGFLVVGLAAEADHELYDPELDLAGQPLVLVVGSEGRGLSRLVSRTCDLRVAIPMAATVESLNASVAAAVALAEIARRRTAP